MKKILSVILACALIAAFAAGCASNNSKATESSKKSESGDPKGTSKSTPDSAQTDAAPSEKTDITFVLDWTPNTNHTGLYVALEKGYFADAGLNVELVQPPEDGAELMVGAGQAQFGVSFQDSMLPTVAGDSKMPIAAVAAILQHNTSGIISLKGKGMDTPKGLEDKKYATWELPIELATLKQVVEADGGDFDKVELIPSTVTDEVSALQSGQVDAIWIFYGWAGVATEVAGLETDYFAFKDIDPVFDYYTPVIIGNTDWMSSHPDAAKAFLAAAKKGYEYAIDNPDDAADILLKAVPELDNGDLVKKSQAYLSKEYKADAAEWGVIDPERWNAFYNWINENGLFTEEIPENTGFTNDYLPQ